MDKRTLRSWMEEKIGRSDFTSDVFFIEPAVFVVYAAYTDYENFETHLYHEFSLWARQTLLYQFQFLPGKPYEAVFLEILSRVTTEEDIAEYEGK
jgi:hypothetical protein